MRDDLDAPGALGILDRWADRLLADAPTRITPADVAVARLLGDTTDALLGIGFVPERVACNSCHDQLRQTVFFEPPHDSGHRPLTGWLTEPDPQP